MKNSHPFGSSAQTGAQVNTLLLLEKKHTIRLCCSGARTQTTDARFLHLELPSLAFFIIILYYTWNKLVSSSVILNCKRKRYDMLSRLSIVCDSLLTVHRMQGSALVRLPRCNSGIFDFAQDRRLLACLLHRYITGWGMSPIWDENHPMFLTASAGEIRMSLWSTSSNW